MINNSIQRRGFVNWRCKALQRRQEDDKDYGQEQHYTRIVLGDKSRRARAIMDGKMHKVLSEFFRAVCVASAEGVGERTGIPPFQEMTATSLHVRTNS